MEWTIGLGARTGCGEVTTCAIGPPHRSLGDLTGGDASPSLLQAEIAPGGKGPCGISGS